MACLLNKAPCVENTRERLHNLEVIQPDGECRALAPDERSALLAEMAEKGELTFGRVRTLLGMKKSREYGRNYTFNLEQGGEKHLLGNRTAAKLLGILGDRWRGLPAERQQQLVNEILSFESEEPLLNRLTGGWGFDAAAARAIAETPLEPGYGSLSRKAIRRLLPLMAQGKSFPTARKCVYGDVLQARQPFDCLPAKHDCGLLRNLRNPAVARALSELRKVVNTLIRKYGKPREVHIELARDLKHSRKHRRDLADRGKKNRQARDATRRKILEEMKDARYANERNVLKVRLAEECNWECPYTGRGISMEALVGDRPQFDIEHIVPFSRSLDNSYLNKTLCYHEENRKGKRGRTPFEAYAQSDRWAEILARVRRFQADPHTRRRKLELFQVEKLPDAEDFAERQLNDTRYMSRLAADYLGLLFGGQIDTEHRRRVRVSPGRVTAYLRQRWNLNSILGHSDEKERADHRHHAIDALVVALSGAREVQLLSRAAEEAERLGQTALFVPVELPWDEFLDQATRAVQQITVSSRVSRKLSGKLHKETIFSKPIPCGVDRRGRPLQAHHLRKRLESLSIQDVPKIVDGPIRALVQQKLDQAGGDLKRAFGDPNNHPYLKSKEGRIIPVHKVRVRVSDKPMIVGRGSKQRYVNPGSNHHIEIVAVLDEQGREKKWEGHVVSTFEAVQRRRRAEPVVRRDHGRGKRFKFSLAGGEHVEMEHQCGKRLLYRVARISKGEIEFHLHSDARPSTILEKIPGARVRRSPGRLFDAHARKVAVDPLGNVFPAND